jgi:hypothetical protein
MRLYLLVFTESHSNLMQLLSTPKRPFDSLSNLTL